MTSGFFHLTYKIIGETGFSTNKSNKAVEFHVSFYDWKVVLINIFYAESVTDNYKHAIFPL